VNCSEAAGIATPDHEDASEPADFLVANVGLLPVGRVLDVAAGSGRNAIYLAGLGFSVTGIDRSEEAVAAALEAAGRAGVTIDMRLADLEVGRPIEKDAYEVIICFNYLQRSLVPQIKEGLRRGGFLVYETFTIDQARFGRPRNPDYLLQYNELLEMFRDFRCRVYREGVFKGKAVAGIVAEKVRAGGTA
jgi:tellurite methyltransferase